MKKTGLHRVLMGLFLAFVAVSLSSQSVVSIDTGTYQGTVDASSGTFDGYRGQEYELRVRGGTEYQIDLISGDFDTYLLVYLPDGTRLTNDDGGSGLNSRLVTTPNSSGTMRIIARGFSRSPSGTFTLTVAQGGSGGAMTSRTISPGTYSGNLDASSGEFEGDRADEYQVRVSANTSYEIDLTSSDFDTYLVVIHPDGSRYNDDDGGSGFNSRLVTTPSSSGTMRVIARGFSSSPSGEYSLAVAQADSGEPMSSRTISPGTYSGNLNASSGEYDGFRADEYRMRVSADTRYEIALDSSDFDAYLVVIHPDGSSHRNDDGGSGLNSLLATTPSSSGTMRIIARSFSRTPNGNYTLSVEEAQSVSRSSRSVEPGTYSARLDVSSGEYEGNRADEYQVRVSANTPYEINLTSSEFDTYLVVIHPDGSRYNDDDGGSGLNSRMVTTPSSSGTMRVIARGFSSSPSGDYMLSISVADTESSMSGSTIDVGTYTGTLSASSEQFEGYRADEYQMRVSAGTSYFIGLDSSDFDTYLVVIHPDGSRHNNDDGGSGLNSALSTTPQTSGMMRIIVRGFQQDPSGQYSLQVQGPS
ncbi:MAG: hypothetical protein ACLFNQ_13795 [Spirochaetaceae bacterium]